MPYVIDRPRCTRCGVRHRTWNMRATCLLWPTVWVAGNPPTSGRCFARVNDCSSEGRVVMLYATKRQAMESKRLLDKNGCGFCHGDHWVQEVRP